MGERQFGAGRQGGALQEIGEVRAAVEHLKPPIAPACTYDLEMWDTAVNASRASAMDGTDGLSKQELLQMPRKFRERWVEILGEI